MDIPVHELNDNYEDEDIISMDELLEEEALFDDPESDNE